MKNFKRGQKVLFKNIPSIPVGELNVPDNSELTIEFLENIENGVVYWAVEEYPEHSVNEACLFPAEKQKAPYITFKEVLKEQIIIEN